MENNCQQCGIQLETDGSCPVCLLQLGILQPAELDPAKPAFAGLPSLEQLQEQFPQLQINRLIGRGGMGAIYHARQTSLDRDVALKLIAKEVAGEAAFIERFEREAKTLAKLSHPNIVTVYDFGRTNDGLAYLVMEYVDGINLREAIDTKSVDQEDALEVVSTICGALEYAHSKGVVHRDIKPENILLGENGTLKVADFGIAKIVDDSVRTPTLTATRQVLGSMHYLAPEQLEAPLEVDHRVDLYALGVIFYELLTGQLPLGRYEPPSTLDRHVDRRIDAIVMKTLSRKPIQRYQSASELSSDILAFRTPQAVVEDSSPGRSYSDSAASVPFTMDAYGGFAKVVGVLLAKNGNLQAEFRIRDSIWGTIKSRTHVIEIPVEKLTKLDLQRRLFSARLLVVADRISTLGDFPNAETGRVELNIERSDMPLARTLVENLGFSSQLPNVTPSEDVEVTSRWTIFGVLLLICCALNALMMTALSALIATEAAYAAFIPLLLIAPIALLQFAAGITAFTGRMRPLSQIACVVSLVPVTPVWFVSLPLAIWSLRWLRHVERQPQSAIGQPAHAGSKSWGATTMMFIRESRWSKIVAGLNIAAIVLALVGFGLYRFGAYPTELKFRVVDSQANSQELVPALNQRLGSLATIVIDRTEPIFFTANAFGYQREAILQALSIERPIELVWLASGTAPQLIATQEQRKSYLVASGISLDGATIERSSPLGPLCEIVDNPVVLEADLVSQLSGEAGTISLEFSRKGREMIERQSATSQAFAGLGLVVDGVIEAYAGREQISGKRAVFRLGDKSQVTPKAIIAAVRGPAIPSELELLE